MNPKSGRSLWRCSYLGPGHKFVNQVRQGDGSKGGAGTGEEPQGAFREDYCGYILKIHL